MDATSNDDKDRTEPQKFQFHLRTLFICMTAAGVVFALIGRWGVAGFFGRLFGAFAFACFISPFVELYYWWKENGR